MHSLALLVLWALVAMSQGKAQQFHDPSLARILQEQRFNVANSKFGHATQQEDGVIVREESSESNNRVGQYQYIGDDGKTYTVKYEAGVNGFRILGGDHIPSGGQTAADAEPDVEYDYQYYDDTLPESVFVNPHDPTHHKADLLAGDLAGHLAGVYRPPTPEEEAERLRLKKLQQQTLPNDRANRFFPPGQLQFDRFEDGFNYKFKSQ